MRTKSPEKYAEIAAKLIMASEPAPQGGFADCKSTADVARKQLVDCGASDFAIDEQMIKEAIEANDQFVQRLGEIASRAIQ